METDIKENIFARSPTLETVMMVEKTIEEYSGEFNRTQIWKKLPKKVMWQTYLTIIDYLGSINKIAISKEGIIVHIWREEIAKKYIKRREINNVNHYKKINNPWLRQYCLT
jgi:hypothetical protein